ncbi:DUF418 domain-containing protein [Sphingomonas bacterium]|uniref:DUF418 domain-containing protein n=1 Tax=Sphingomonas bacterium TaxID=1895847 RepID=UPI001575AF15|nr:DUF418 domain-containing protein [Sphingomonas bacterium]
MADRESGATVQLAPVTGRARIDVLDMLRGIAILGIFYMNIPFMGGTVQAAFGDPRLQGWMPADRWAWSIIEVVAEGTQRGTLEMLFGAGMMILTAKAMTPTGPVAVADLYMRRTLWLLVFGLLDVFALLWPGDILHTYALASLFLFPFRKLAPRTLLILGLLWGTLGFVGGAAEYPQRVALVHKVEAAHVAQAAHTPLSKDQKEALAEWGKKLDKLRLTPKQKKEMAEEAKARRGGFLGYAKWLHLQWIDYAKSGELFWVLEAFSTMLIGVALFKWGFIQGLSSSRTYLVAMIAAYAFGFGARAMGVHERLAFWPIPKTIWATEEYARLAVTLGHIALVNLLARTRAGYALLSPFKAAGRIAFSLYVAETLIGMWLLFPGFGLGLWDKFGWAGLAVTATVTIVVLLIAANIYSRYFVIGPLEWAWRSLAYCKRQRFRRHDESPPAIVVGP